MQIRVQAIRALPLFGKDSSEYVAKIVDVLGQLLVAGNDLHTLDEFPTKNSSSLVSFDR